MHFCLSVLSKKILNLIWYHFYFFKNRSELIIEYEDLSKNALYLFQMGFDVMLMLLTCVAASTDVISYFRLGNVFTANMTGNAILLGLSVEKGALSISLLRLSSLLGFIIGVFIGSLIVTNKKKEWLYNVKLVIAVESFIIGALAIIWLLHAVPLKNEILYIAILLSSVSMGMQSAAIWHLGIPGIATTFLTGNITSIALNTVNGWRVGFKKRIKNEISDNAPFRKI